MDICGQVSRCGFCISRELAVPLTQPRNSCTLDPAPHPPQKNITLEKLELSLQTLSLID